MRGVVLGFTSAGSFSVLNNLVSTLVIPPLSRQVEEFYVITWTAKKEQIFEMPTGGAAIMRQGPNLLKLARKEQCLALTTQLRTKFKTDACFYRVFPNGEVQYLHPKDGVYPEKVSGGAGGQRCRKERTFSDVFYIHSPLTRRFTHGSLLAPSGQRRPQGSQPEHAPYRPEREPHQR